MELSIQAWAAWTPEWCYPVIAEATNNQPDVSWVLPGSRRRLSFFTKMAFYVAKEVAAAEPSEMIFATRHGDLCKTLKQLDNLVVKEPISPTQFALSVHNATAGQYGILSSNQRATTTISAGSETLEAALFAAYARLTSNPELENIIVVFVDETIPAIYQGPDSPAETSVALALRLAKPNSSAPAMLSIEAEPGLQGISQRSRVHPVLEFFRKNKSSITYAINGYNLHWNHA